MNWVIWRTDDEEAVFDLDLNIPVLFSDRRTAEEVVRLMRESGADEYSRYPGPPCG